MTLTNRTLAVIADELHAALKRETADILTIGTLLVEAKAQVGHGKWLSWLKQEFSMSERSAQKYMKAAEFAAKNELSADLDLSPSALYLLSEDSHWEDRCDRRTGGLPNRPWFQNMLYAPGLFTGYGVKTLPAVRGKRSSRSSGRR